MILILISHASTFPISSNTTHTSFGPGKAYVQSPQQSQWTAPVIVGTVLAILGIIVTFVCRYRHPKSQRSGSWTKPYLSTINSLIV